MLLQRLLCLCVLATSVLSASHLPSTTRSTRCPVEIDQDQPDQESRIIVPNPANLSALYQRQVQPRIVNGDFASPNLLKYMVAIWTPQPGNFVTLCTGTLVSATWVITAAHCQIKKGDLVQIGVAHAEPRDDRAFTKVKKSVPHPDWREYPEGKPNPTSKYDIAVFELDDPAPSSAKFMKVNADIARPQAGEFARAMGYGTTEVKTDGVGTGRQVDVPISEDGVCRDTYEYIEDNKQVCAGYQDGGCDSCQGDSGGPLIQYDGNEPVLIGVISFGQGCAEKGFPGVYVRTSAYKSFFDENRVFTSSSGSSALSFGAIAGIAIVGALLVTAAVVGAMFYFRKRRTSPKEGLPTTAVAPGAPTQPSAAPPTEPGHPGAPPSGGMPTGVPTVPVYPATPTQAPIAAQVPIPPQVPSPPNVLAQTQPQPQAPLPPPPQVPGFVPPPPPSSGMS